MESPHNVPDPDKAIEFAHRFINHCMVVVADHTEYTHQCNWCGNRWLSWQPLYIGHRPACMVALAYKALGY